MAWVFLAIAIGLEVAGTLALRMARRAAGPGSPSSPSATSAPSRHSPLALSEGLGLGVAYGIWAAAGVALTAVASRLLFDEPLTPLMGVGIGLIAGGVLLVELGAVSAG